MKYHRKNGLLFGVVPLYEGEYGETLVNMCLNDLLSYLDDTDIVEADFVDGYVERSWGNQYGSWVSLGYNV